MTPSRTPGAPTQNLQLRPFMPRDATRVLTWISAGLEAELWCGDAHLTLDPETFERWHAEPDVHAFVLLDEHESLVGYGEVWDDPDEDEVELARLVIDPARRGNGLGRSLVRELVRAASRFERSETWLRVDPRNVAALACYRGAGFVDATPAQCSSFNEGDPRAYLWLAGPS